MIAHYITKGFIPHQWKLAYASLMWDPDRRFVVQDLAPEDTARIKKMYQMYLSECKERKEQRTLSELAYCRQEGLETMTSYTAATQPFLKELAELFYWGLEREKLLHNRSKKDNGQFRMILVLHVFVVLAQLF